MASRAASSANLGLNSDYYSGQSTSASPNPSFQYTTSPSVSAGRGKTIQRQSTSSSSNIPTSKGIIVLKEYAEEGQVIDKNIIPVVTSSTNPVSFATSRQHFDENAPDTVEAEEKPSPYYTEWQDRPRSPVSTSPNMTPHAAVTPSMNFNSGPSYRRTGTASTSMSYANNSLPKFTRSDTSSTYANNSLSAFRRTETSNSMMSNVPKSKFDKIGLDRGEADRLAAARADAAAQARLNNYGKPKRLSPAANNIYRAEGDDFIREEGDDFNLELLGPD
jgi:hypothetical protein